MTDGGEWLDLYVKAKFKLGQDMPVELRFGRQVLSLGESTFLPNGINVVNPVDLSKLRGPGNDYGQSYFHSRLVRHPSR